MNGNKVKAEQLGMPFGTASGRLRKMLLYDMAKRLDEDKCYRCKISIDSIDDFTIDHKDNWLHSETPKDLFFDLNNIAFSHTLCNMLAQRKPRYSKKSNIKARRKIVEGKAFCTKGAHWTKVEDFTKDNHTQIGLKATCRECRRRLYREGKPR